MHHVRDPTDAGRDDRPPGRQRFDRTHRGAFAARGQKQGVEGVEPRPHVVLEAHEADRVVDPELACEGLERGAVGAVTDHDQRRVDAAIVQQADGTEDVGGLLRRGHARNPPDREARRRDAERCAELSTTLGSLHPLRELDPEPDDCEPRRWRDADCDELVPHLRADGDESVGIAREAALDPPVGALAKRVEFAQQHVTVEGVDDDRWTRIAHEAGREPARRARLCGVGVEHVRSLSPDQLPKPPDGAQVVERRDLAPQFGDPLDVDASLLGDERH